MDAKDPQRVDQRCTDKEIVESISHLKLGYAEIREEQKKLQEAIAENTSLTKDIKDIIESVKGFFSFAQKMGRFGVKLAKWITIFSAAIIAAYQALDAVMTHNLLDFFKGKK